jgi:DNA-binding transcriptional regulator YhcF (GntR family)
MPWRDHVPVHPAAETLPLLGKKELQELADDIKKRGLMDKIVVYQDVKTGKEMVVDGRNRLDALELNGVNVLNDKKQIHSNYKKKWLTNGGTVMPDVNAYVKSFNVHRRHLNSKQKREAIERLLKASPEKGNRTIAKEVGVSFNTVKKKRKELEASNGVKKVPSGQRIRKDGQVVQHSAEKIELVAKATQKNPERTLRSLAEEFGISKSVVHEIKSGKYKPAEQKTCDSPQEAHAPKPRDDGKDEAALKASRSAYVAAVLKRFKTIDEKKDEVFDLMTALGIKMKDFVLADFKL